MAAKKRAKKATTKRGARKPSKKRATRRAARKAPAKKTAKRSAAKASFGRAGTAGKAEGRDAVNTWLSRVKSEQRPIVDKIDAMIADEVPDVRYAVKWSSPMYGREGIGWFASMGSFKAHVGVNFFNGVALKPQPSRGEGKGMRSVRIERIEDLDEKQLRDWIGQASTMPGWGKV